MIYMHSRGDYMYAVCVGVFVKARCVRVCKRSLTQHYVGNDVVDESH